MLLRFTLEWSIHPRRDQDYAVFGTYVRICVAVEGGSDSVHLGHGHPEVAWTERAREGIPYRTPLIYNLTLPADQLLALESRRQNRGLVFRVEVRGNTLGQYGVGPLDETLSINVGLGDWLRILAEGGTAEALLIGLPLSLAPDSDASTPLVLVRQAHRFLQSGEYDACVAECRRAMESLWKAAGVQDAAKRARGALANPAQRRAMTKLDRTLAMGEALVSLTQPAHHVGDDGDPEIFSRAEATLALATAASLVGAISAPKHRPDPSEETTS
ncbi:MAG: hypothetical protein HRU81_04555 [Gammaproteobacteria bacterium]|nr:MAG: hypothetical protein HRU81_04555 [Gammaproteobacteria bacterium]